MARKVPLNPSNHIQTPSPFSPPPDVLRRLREVDPDADLHCLGDGRWAVGAVKRTKERCMIGGRMLARLTNDPEATKSEMRLAYLHSEGFGLIDIYEAHELGHAPADFRRMDRQYREGGEEEHDRRVAESELTAHRTQGTAEELIEQIRLREKSEWSRIFRDRTHSIPH